MVTPPWPLVRHELGTAGDTRATCGLSRAGTEKVPLVPLPGVLTSVCAPLPGAQQAPGNCWVLCLHTQAGSELVGWAFWERCSPPAGHATSPATLTPGLWGEIQWGLHSSQVCKAQLRQSGVFSVAALERWRPGESPSCPAQKGW